MTRSEATTTDVAGINAIVERAARLLPPQGPIGVFVAQNPLMGIESEPFEAAVVRAADLFQAEPFLPESSYRAELERGRITVADIDAVLDEEHAAVPGQPVARTLCDGRVTVRDLHRVLLVHRVSYETDASVSWALTEGRHLERFRDDLPPETRWQLLTEGLRHPRPARVMPRLGPAELPADPGARDDDLHAAFEARTTPLGGPGDERQVVGELWEACLEAVGIAGPICRHLPPPVRHRDLLIAADPALDTDALVHPLLIRWCAAFLDQGVAAWPMPGRDRGLLDAVCTLHGRPHWARDAWADRLPAALAEVRGRPAAEVVVGELTRLGVPPTEWEGYVTRSLLALKGWAGMIRHLELRPDRAPVVAVPARLMDFLALRLVCDRVATDAVAGRIGCPAGDTDTGPVRHDLGGLWTELRDRFPPKQTPGTLARAFVLHQVAQLVGLTAADVLALDENEIVRFEAAILSFDATARRRLLHRAYERRFREQSLTALQLHRRVEEARGAAAAVRPLLQAVLCMDERCESFRRHLEEIGPRYVTLGTAGFFGVAMRYRGVDDWHAAASCPIVIRPGHTVTEVPLDEWAARHDRVRGGRRVVGRLAAGITSGSRTLVAGGLVSVCGALAAVPLVARVALPRLSAALWSRAARLAGARVRTRLDLERHDDRPLPDGTLAGFSVAEMAGIVRRVLEDIGLTSGFARVVAILGHGSSSRNNPHESAYHCGACGGGPGGANARAFAMMANDGRVRDLLAADGIRLPGDTVFLGGMLDTCSNTVTWYDEDLLPATHRDDLAKVRAACDHATTADAQERCRRFDSAPTSMPAMAARFHVEGRAVDLAQVRPELGHATNALCVVGRRSLTRGLYLDRRAFLVSYDPCQDEDGAILTRTLAAVGPVASGINLAYFFSRVDRLRYGCDTKLPHNITGLIGVMDGQASDLRTGLPWQTVEIHEPLRLLLVIESPIDRILAAAGKLPGVRQLFENGWVQLAAWDPAPGGGLAVFRGGRFEPHAPERLMLPVVERSRDWYAGHREHLPPARLLAGLAAGGAGPRPRTVQPKVVGAPA